MTENSIPITPIDAGKTLAAVLRRVSPNLSWSQVKRLIAKRRVRVGEGVCMDPARRLREGEVITLLARPDAPPPTEEAITIRHVDEHIIVVEKPAGINTVRHPLERDWNERRRALSPTLDDLVTAHMCRIERTPRNKFPRLRIVHRLDKQTSGLLVFARTVEAERNLGAQFKKHTVHRRYFAVIPGYLKPQTIVSNFVRDRGDRRRGSTPVPGAGKKAVTHIEVEEKLPGYTLLSCRLETGRTHQIRIHLAEAGHPVCGDPVYHIRPGGELIPDKSNAPRLALHAAELGFRHPVTGEEVHWTTPLPEDLREFIIHRLRAK